MKDISFWSVVIAIVIIFFVQHILNSFNVIEQINNQNDTFNIVNSFKEGVKRVNDNELKKSSDQLENEDDRDYEDDEEYTFYPLTLFFSNSKDTSIIGLSSIECREDLNVENMKKLCKFIPDCDGFIHSLGKDEGPGEGCLLRNIDTSKPKIMLEGSKKDTYSNSGLYHYNKREKDDYDYYKYVDGIYDSRASSLGCNNNEPLYVAEAKYKCDNAIDCDGFYYKNSNEKSKACFMRDVDVSKGFQVIPDPTIGKLMEDKREPGFYVNTRKK